MSEEIGHRTAGWCIPSPLKRSRFVSLHPEHDVHNVEVDLGAIGAFGCQTDELDRESLLYSDLQTQPRLNQGVALGSGRSGFHRGKYLKGVGRTPLAGNWAMPAQVYHGSGHLMASGGIRELVVTHYLKARGLAGTIVGCEGILLAPLDPRLQQFVARAFPGKEPAPIDRTLQAITVKDGHFARSSNFIWMLEHCGPGVTARFFQHLRHFLDSPGDDPGALARAIAGAVERMLRAHAGWVQAGVYWGSFNNNAALDGRFLDLEVVTLFGAGIVGVLVEEGTRATLANHPLVGCELLQPLITLRATLEHWRGRFARLSALGVIEHPVEREFIEEFFVQLDRELGPHHLLWSREAACAHVSRMLGDVLGLSRARRAALRPLVEAQYLWLVDQRTASPTLTLRRAPITLARAESVLRLAAWVPELLPEPNLTVGHELNRRLDELENVVTVDAALDGLQSLLRDIARPTQGEHPCPKHSKASPRAIPRTRDPKRRRSSPSRT